MTDIKNSVKISIRQLLQKCCKCIVNSIIVFCGGNNECLNSCLECNLVLSGTHKILYTTYGPAESEDTNCYDIFVEILLRNKLTDPKRIWWVVLDD
jgi:hypothetical protein